MIHILSAWWYKLDKVVPQIGITIRIKSGLGLGKIFIESLNKSDVIIKLLGCSPYPGTLFAKTKQLREISGFVYDSHKFKVILAPATLKGEKVLVKWTNYFPYNFQIIAAKNLRESLFLTENNEYILIFNENNLKFPNLKIILFGLRQTIQETTIRIKDKLLPIR